MAHVLSTAMTPGPKTVVPFPQGTFQGYLRSPTVDDVSQIRFRRRIEVEASHELLDVKCAAAV
jgi:hypothetical protein